MSAPAPGTRSIAPRIALCVLFLALTIPMALLGRLGTSEAGDQERYHWPTIVAMSEAWPTVSLQDYRTATGPLYHVVLAGIVAIIGDEQWPIRIINAIVSLPIVLLVFSIARRRASPWLAALYALPIALSPYVLSSAIWITTDNVAHWLVIAALVAATSTAAGRTAMCSALAVGVRQIHIWVIAPCALAQLLPGKAHASHQAPSPEGERRRTAGEGVPRRVLGAALVAIPASIVVALLVWWWGGLTPPYVEARHTAIGNPFGFGFALALLGVAGIFFLPLTDPWSTLQRSRAWMLPAALALALALTVLSPTTLDKSEGRWGGAIWAVVDELPDVAGRSIVFPPLAMMGALFLLTGCRRAALLGRVREALIVFAALASFTAAHAVQPWCAQRYFEPMILVLAMWLGTLGMTRQEAISAASQKRMPVEYWLGPAMLAAIQAVSAAYAVYWQTRPADM